MADAQVPEVAVEPAAVEKVPTPDNSGEKSIRTSVWAPTGGVAKSSILQAAIQSVRDAIPVVYDLSADIIDAKKKLNEGAQGTEFIVEITYTAREVSGGKHDPVDVDKVIKGLEVPRSIPEGDPDFLGQR